ncbi:MAG: lycopene cyclase family protein, partial [Myxococcota bacterium]
MADPERWEHVFAGGGIAASLLALRLGRDGVGPMLVIDPTPEDPRTFVYWADRPLDLDAYVEHDWTKLRLADATGTLHRALGPYRYRLVRAEVLHAAARRAVEASGGRVICGRVTAIEDGPEAAVVVVDGARYPARWVYDSRPLDPPQGLVQGIVGAWVETEDDAFEPDTATLMDFRAPQETGAVRFFHVMPTSARRALVTGVTFADEHRPIDLDAYLSQVLGLAHWRITGREGGSTRMTDHRFPRRTGTRVLTLGNAGGRLKASTGYALVRIHD